MTLKAVQDYYHHMIFDPAFIADEATLTGLLSPAMSAHILAQPENRRAIYRGFIQNNVSDIIKTAFETFFAFLPDGQGNALVRGFLNRHNPRTNIYKNIPNEFFADLSKEAATRFPWPFLLDLAEADFLDYDLRLRPNFKKTPTDPNLPLQTARLLLNPALEIRKTDFDITRITVNTKPEQILPQKTHYARYRHPETFVIETVTLNELSFTFLQNIMAQPNKNFIAQIAALECHFPKIPTDDLTENLISFLGKLLSRKMVLGLY